MKRFAEYIRVSTLPQAKRFGPEVQHTKNLAYVEAQGGVIVETYQDADSGAKPTRTNFDRLLRDAKAGRFEAVVTYSVARVGRLASIALQFADDLRRLGLEVHGSSSGAYNLKSASGRFRYQIDSIFGEYQYEDLIQNMYNAKFAKAKAGGLPQNWEPYGRRARYLPDGTRVVEIYEPEAVWVRRAFEWARDGVGTHKILARLDQAPPPRRAGYWSHSGVRYMLHNRSYAGVLEYTFKRTDQPVRVAVHVEPIVPMELFEEVQRALADRKRGGRRNSRIDLPLVGLVRCGGCGWRLNLSHYEVKKAHFRCINRFCPEAGYHIMYAKAERLLLELLRQAAKSPDFPVLPPAQASGSRDDLERDLANLAKRRGRILEMVELGLYTPEEGKARIAALQDEIAAIEAQVVQAQSAVGLVVDVSAWRERLKKIMNDPRPELLKEVRVALVTWRDRRAALKMTY